MWTLKNHREFRHGLTLIDTDFVWPQKNTKVTKVTTDSTHEIGKAAISRVKHRFTRIIKLRG